MARPRAIKVFKYHRTVYEHDHHSHDRGPGRRLGWALGLTLAFAGVEAIAGGWAGSLALLSDAGHMLTDSSGLALAVLAAWFARRPADAGHSWGHGRAETLAAFANALLMLILIAGIVWGAARRLQSPVVIQGDVVFGVALVGLVINLVILYTLSHGPQNLNIRGAVLHVMGDTLGSVAALASGAVIVLTGWTPIDPILSLVICGLILTSGVRLMRDSVNVVMEGVPAHLKLEDIGRAIARTPGVVGVHDLHIWQVHSDQIALSAHVVLRHMDDWLRVLQRLRDALARDYGIQHVTLQPEPVPEVKVPLPGKSRPA
ncbi:MAG: cation diffusion facilitator family transporter [Nevskiales bacterium]|nr:cation diffusion facilitator family transporter [Nevskiales bacterium]